MRAQQELDLQPDRMLGSELLAVVEIILEPNLRELAGVKGQARRNAGALAAENIVGMVSAGAAVGVIAAQAGDPALFETPEHLGVEAPVLQCLRRQRNRRVG